MHRFSLTESVAPSVEPITTAQAKKQINIEDFTDDDTYIGLLIKKARVHYERLTRRSLINTTWVQRMDGFPRIIRPARSPLSSVTSITFLDENGVSQTWATTDFQVDLFQEPGRIMPISTGFYPTTQSGTFNTVTVTFVAGYGAAASSIDEDILGTLKLLVAHFYKYREPVVGEPANRVPHTIQDLIMLQRVLGAA